MFELLEIILRKWKLTLAVCLLTAIVSAGLSLLLPNIYESHVVFQPGNPNALDRSVVFPSEGSDRAIYIFGGNGDRDRIISLATSGEMYNFLTDKFDLFNHYEIDKTEKYAHFKLIQELEENYVIQKNALNAIEIKVHDKSPEFAAKMANAIYDKVDKMNYDIIQAKKKDIRVILETQSVELKQKTTALRDSLQNVLTRNSRDTITANYINTQLESALDEYANVASKLDQYNKILNLNTTTLYLYEKAVPATRKDKPKRSYIVIGAVLFMFLVMIISTLFIEKYKQFIKES